MSTTDDLARRREREQIDQYFAKSPIKEKWRIGRALYFGAVIGTLVVAGIATAIADEAGNGGASAAITLAMVVALGFIAAARARDANRNVVGWILLALIVPFCWIVLGCFHTAAADAEELRKTFE
jgi:uncharacterized membrane protein